MSSTFVRNVHFRFLLSEGLPPGRKSPPRRAWIASAARNGVLPLRTRDDALEVQSGSTPRRYRNRRSLYRFRPAADTITEPNFAFGRTHFPCFTSRTRDSFESQKDRSGTAVAYRAGRTPSNPTVNPRRQRPACATALTCAAALMSALGRSGKIASNPFDVWIAPTLVVRPHSPVSRKRALRRLGLRPQRGGPARRLQLGYRISPLQMRQETPQCRREGVTNLHLRARLIA